MQEILLMIHMVGLAFGLGVGFTHIFLGRSRSKMTKEAAQKDALRGLSLVIMSNIGIILLVLSGAVLMSPYWSILGESPLLIAKLSLVVILIILLVIININAQKALKAQGGSGLMVIKKIGKFPTYIILSIVVLAILMFH